MQPPPASPASLSRPLSRRAALGVIGTVLAGAAGAAFPRRASARDTSGTHEHCGGEGPSARAAVEHPEPRPGITADHVLPDDQVKERARGVYAKAREIPEVLDGLYCHCDCAKRHDLRSLLGCFESTMAAGCGICSGEAALAHTLHGEGKSLDEIRAAIDERYGD